LLLDRGTDKIAICSFHLFNFFSGVQRMATLRPLMSVLASSLAANVMLLSPAAADAPFAFDTTPGRLPKNVVPIDYQIAIVPDVKAKTFTGTESVSLKFRAATATVIFNTLNLTLTGVRLDGKPVKQVASDNTAQLTKVTLAAPASVGLHTLTFAYSGQIGSGPQGLFLQPYVAVDGSNQVMLSTEMESTDARRMFACWDEPAFRATFQLTATVPAAWATVSNMPVTKRVVNGSLATTQFARSPRMPSYLVEFSAGDLRHIDADHDGVHFGVWAVRGRETDGQVALANAQQILADYVEYFGAPYPLPKLDSIAIPGGFSGAMENWGAITYMDQLLLLSKMTSIADAQEVYSTQAHEMAHQWNGDLVTMGWWDHLWLNESFASWRAAKETDLRNPSWKWWERQDAERETAMMSDAQGSSHAIEQHVTDELQAANAFDPSITYAKGQAVLRMFEAYLGPDTFRDGIRRYIKAQAFGNATSADLWNALSAASGKDVGAIAAGWTTQPGFPLVSVKATCDAAGNRTISLSQQRFLLRRVSNPAANPHVQNWQVPLQVRTGATGKTHSLLLTQNAQTAPAGSCRDPLSVDADAIGFYRVQYDEATLATNTRNFGALADGDRIAMLDDEWALVDSGVAPLPSFLALAAAMGSDLDTRAWEKIAGSLGTVEYDERGGARHDAFSAYARSIIKPVAERLGWDAKPGETPDTQRLRRTLIGDLAAWGDEQVVAEARRRFARFTADRATLGPDDQFMVLSIVGLYADAATFDQLHTLGRQAKDDAVRRRFYVAMASVRDPKLAEQAARIALDPEIPVQAADLRLEMVIRLNNVHHQLAWSTFSAHSDTLLSPQGQLAPLVMAQYIPQYLWDSVPPDQLETWIKAHVPAQMADNVAKGMEAVRFKVSEKQMLVAAADGYLAKAK
jgi:aminopeptidase N